MKIQTAVIPGLKLLGWLEDAVVYNLCLILSIHCVIVNSSQ